MNNPVCPICGGELITRSHTVTRGILYDCLECERSWTDEQLDLYDEGDEDEEDYEEEDEQHGDED